LSRKNLLKKVKRIVVKIGSSSITENGKISGKKISAITDDIVALLKAKYSVIIVSSGAISAGAGQLKTSRKNITIPKKQALAAVGQTVLMNEWKTCFSKQGYEVGQILLTEDDVKNRTRFVNARHTFNSLIELNAVPIVNENDSVVIKEIKVGDEGGNDILSAHVTNITEADLLILLSDVDGFYNDRSDSQPVEEITVINDDVLKRAGGTGSIHGTGGMLSKIKAAEMIIKCGEIMIIANGSTKGILPSIMNGENTGTLFRGNECILPGRKRWIAFNMSSKGNLKIDDGAFIAIKENKKSLLSTGIIEIKGRFEPGDAVDIQNSDGTKIGKGVVNYNFNELRRIIGKKTKDIKEILGSEYYDEVINRDDMIID
jgi:glutamate 5-kinase